MLFITEVRPDLPVYISRLGRTIQFADGKYETTDPAEITALRRNRHVTDFSAVERDLTTPSPLDKPERLALNREELDELARQAGVEHPERLPTKDAVAQAIQERRDADQPSDH